MTDIKIGQYWADGEGTTLKVIGVHNGSVVGDVISLARIDIPVTRYVKKDEFLRDYQRAEA